MKKQNSKFFKSVKGKEKIELYDEVHFENLKRKRDDLKEEYAIIQSKIDSYGTLLIQVRGILFSFITAFIFVSLQINFTSIGLTVFVVLSSIIFWLYYEIMNAHARNIFQNHIFKLEKALQNDISLSSINVYTIGELSKKIRLRYVLKNEKSFVWNKIDKLKFLLIAKQAIFLKFIFVVSIVCGGGIIYTFIDVYHTKELKDKQKTAIEMNDGDIKNSKKIVNYYNSDQIYFNSNIKQENTYDNLDKTKLSIAINKNTNKTSLNNNSTMKVNIKQGIPKTGSIEDNCTFIENKKITCNLIQSCESNITKSGLKF